jgi:hypothetical protein
VTIAEVLAVLAEGRARHMCTEPAGERELGHLEEALGGTLPADFRTFLSHIGGGILYERHEVFGARRLMVHDIELVPDLVSFRRRFVEAVGPLAEHLVPFHRAEGVVHLLDLRGGGAPSVVSADGTRSYPDLACFFEQFVLPKGAGARP